MTNNHDLVQLVQEATNQIAAEYRRIQSRSSQDPGTAGDQGEENWATLLRNWLPQSFHVLTKGRIIAASSEASPQVDVLVLNPSYPIGLLKTKLYLSAGVVAAFECKNTLKREHVYKAVRTCRKIGEITRTDRNAERQILYGILAHSHTLPSVRVTPETALDQLLDKAIRKEGHGPRDCLDFVCVADLGTWNLMRFRLASENEPTTVRETTSYMGPGKTVIVKPPPVKETHPDPIGRLLTGLLQRIGTTDPSIAKMGTYFMDSGLLGVGQGVVIEWPLADAANEPG